MNDELAEIGERAFEMASSVARTPSLRTDFGREAAQLVARLTAILKESKTLEHAEYSKRCLQIIEALQDLNFVERDSLHLSDRLTGELKRPKDV